MFHKTCRIIFCLAIQTVSHADLPSRWQDAGNAPTAVWHDARCIVGRIYYHV